MNTNEIKKLYTALRGKGYSTYDLGDENAFETKMSDKNNRKELYDWVSSRGDFRMGDYEKYEERLTSPMQPEGTTTDPIRGVSMAPVEQIEQTESVAQSKVDTPKRPMSVEKPKKKELPEQEYIFEDELQADRDAFEKEQYQGLSWKDKAILRVVGKNARQMGVNADPAREILTLDKQKGVGLTDLEERKNVMQAQRNQVSTMRENVKAGLQATQPQEFIWGGVDQAPQMTLRAARAELDANKQKHRTLVAANTALENAQNIIDEADKHGADGTYGDWLQTSFVGGASRGLGDKLFDINNWDMGISDVGDAKMLKDALDQFDNGKPLTEEQKTLLDAKAVELATQAYFGSYLGRGYKAGQVTAESIPFMIEMAINPASAIGKSAGSMMARYALKRFGKGTATKALSRGARVAGDIAGAATMSATTGLGRVAADAAERMAGDIHYDIDQDNQTVFAGHTKGEDPATAYRKAFGATTIENYSEMFGNYFSPILGGSGKMLRKGAESLGAGKVVKMLDDVAASDLAKVVSDFEKNAQWSGTLSEYAEEVAGGIMNAIFVGDQTLDTDEQTGVFNLDNNINTLLGVALLGGAMSTIKTAGYPIHKYQADKRIVMAETDAVSAFGNAEKWAEVKSQLNLEDAVERGKALRNVLADKNLTEEQKVVAFKYVEALQNRDGVRIGEMKHYTDETVPQEQKEIERSFDNGYTLTTPEEKQDANSNLSYWADKLRVDFQMNDDADPEELFEGYDNPLDALYGEQFADETAYNDALQYIFAKATMDGAVQNVRDQIDARVAENNARIDGVKNETDNTIMPATLRQGDRQVFIVRGNISQLDDGSIDGEKSDGHIFIVDAQTLKPEMIAPSAILSLGAIENADTAKETQATQIAELMATEASAQMDGTLGFVQGDTYNILGEDGIQHTAQVVADNVDGSVQIVVDGAQEATTLPKDQVQAMSDAYHKARAIAYNEQKKAEEVVEQEAQVAEEAPQTALSLIPTNENGEQVFEQAPAETTWAALIEMNEGDIAEAADTAQQMLEVSQKELEKATNEKAGVGTSVAEIQKIKAERKAKIDALQNRVNYWTNVLSQNTPTQEVAQAEEVAEPIEAIAEEPIVVEDETPIVEEETPIVEEETAPIIEEAQVAEPIVEAEEVVEPIVEQSRPKVKNISKKEDARRQPLRERVAQWIDKLGVPVVVMETFSDIENADAKREIRKGNRISGWYEPSTGAVMVYMPHVTDMSEIDKTITHEIVAHKGIANLLGKNKHNALLDRVWDMMSEEAKAKYINYPNVNGNTRRAADEYIAFLSEGVNLTELDQSVWDKIVGFVRELLAEVGINMQLTDADIADLIRLSYTNLVRENQKAKETKGADDINEQDGQALFSIRTYEESGRENLQKFLKGQVKKKRITKADAEAIEATMEQMYETAVEYKDKFAPFGAWSEAEVVKGKDGQPVFSVVKKNGEYTMNLDFSTVCKKRRTLDAVFSEMIDRGLIDMIPMEGEQIAEINNIIRDYGFETACALCFVDAKRFRVAQVADKFCDMWNPMTKMSEEELQGVINEYGKDAVRGKIAKRLIAHPEDRIELNRDNFIDSNGFEQMEINHPEILSLYKQAQGTSLAKIPFGDVQYLNELEDKSQWTPKRAYAVGGVRLQSFSDYVPRMFFDYMQMTAGLASKKLPVHAYTKEPIFAKQFGLTGMKINLSLVPKVVEGGVAAGLDADGNYAWMEGETFPFEEAMALQNAEGYRENCGTIAVGVSDEHIEKMLDDPNIRMIIPYHKSGLNPLVAKKNRIAEFTDYTNVQNTRSANGTKLEKEDLKDMPDFNSLMHDEGMDARQAAQAYLDWCDSKGFIPKFNKFRGHQNYYKLLEDFTTIVPNAEGVETTYPQREVTMTFPTEESAFGSIESLIREGLEEDAILEGKREEKLGEIVDTIEKEMVRFRFIGQQGAANLDKAEEATTRLDDLAVARDMWVEGKDAKIIKAATGWEHGADGKWRYEVMDIKVESPEQWVNKRGALKLPAIIGEGDNLFIEYPELRDVKVKKTASSGGGAYSPKDNTISVGVGTLKKAVEILADPARFGQTEETFRPLYDGVISEVEGTLIHEIQHVIQHKEWFAKGGSPGMLNPNYDKESIENQYANMVDAMNRKIREYNALSPIERRTYNAITLRNSIMSDQRKIKKYAKSVRLGDEGYRRLAGEVEARNVDRRRNMSMGERLASLASETEDVARKDQIFIFNALADENQKAQFRVAPEMDAQYLSLVEEGNLEEAQKMVDAAANAAGYNADESWKKAHRAPRKSEDNVNPFNTEELVPADYWTHPEWYTQIRHYQTDRESYYNMLPAINKYKRLVAEGKQDEADKVTVTMYRGVDKRANKKESTFRNGDWITPSRSYALLSAPEGNARVISQDVLLKDIWWDGNSINEWGYDDGANYVYQDTKNNRKSADAVTYDDNGNVIPLSKRFNKRSEDVRFRVADPAPAFYSNAENAVLGIKQEKATPEQWLKMIEKNGGLKAGEDKWLGLSDWLKASDKKILTKQEVLDYINENQIQIEDVEYRDRELMKLEIEGSQQFINLRDEYMGIFEDYMENPEADMSEYEAEQYARDAMVEQFGNYFNVAFATFGKELYVDDAEFAAKLLGLPYAKELNQTRLDYTTQGLTDKREIALTIPTIESWNETDDIHFGDAGDGRAIAWIRFGETTDEYGFRVLVIDEIQSKRHQEGREKGYRPSDVDKYLKDNNVEVVETGEFYEFYRDGELDRRFSKGLLHYNIKEAKNLYVAGYNKSDIPEAPFEKNWAELAMKRMLRYAAENDFDKVAWTKGDQQAERYDLSKSVERIDAEDNNVEEASDGTPIAKNITIRTSNWPIHLYVDANGVIRGGQYANHQLSEVVGKGIAEKLMQKGDVSLSGDGLRIGGEGMKGFYDEMLPRFMNKYGKKWGVKVQDVTLPFVEEAGRTMHSVDVTESMRESVMQGQPMFRAVDTSFAHAYDNAFSELEREYQALDKNNEQDLKAFRTKKQELVQEYLNHMSDNLAMPTTPIVFDASNIDSVKKAYEVLPIEMQEAISLEEFANEVSGLRGFYTPNTTITMFNVAKDDSLNSPREWLGTLVHENSHKVVEGLRISDLDKEVLWNFCKETSPKISTKIEPDYHSDSERGEEYLVYTIQTRVEYERLGDLLVECIMGKKTVQDVILSFKDSLLLRDEIIEQILNTFRDGYRKARRGGSSTTGGDAQTRHIEGPNNRLGRRRERTLQRDNGNGRDLTALRESATELASQLNTPIRIVEDVNTITDNNAKLQERKRNAKGWFDRKANEVVVVLPNATSVEDVRETIFHEVVGHKGLRDLVGKERYDAFLEKVYRGASETIRERIARRAAKLGWDFNLATDEYLADLAEEGFEDRENRNFFEVVRDLFLDMLSEAKIALGFNISDNDLRYMLWRTYQMQRSKGAMGIAEDMVMQQKLGVGNFAPTDGDVRFRAVSPSKISTKGIKQGIRDEYNKLVSTSAYQSREASQDSMLSLRRFMEMTAKAYDIPMEKIKDWENAYQSENALSSKNEAQIEEFDRLYGAPLIQTVQELRKKGYTYEQIDDYLQIKHGIERNREMAVRAAISDEEGKIDKEKLEKWNAAKERVSNDQKLDSWEKEQRELDRIAKEEFEAEFNRDYSGLTAMFPDEKKVADAVEKGYAEVNAFEENVGQNLVNELWRRIRAANMQTLNNTYRTGLISKDTFDSISSMYSYYVPLRGFAETTSDEVYGYLNNEPMAFNAPIRKARGRSSKADQVLPNVLSAAHSAILQGNRNMMKNNFLNFVQHYPTDLVSVQNMWVEYDKKSKQWVATFPDLEDTDTPEEVAAKTQAFEEKMKGLKEKYPNEYKQVTQKIDVPYIVQKQHLKQHQIVVKRNGVDVVLTVNGSPRLAIVMNGTQPTKTLLGEAKDWLSARTRYLSGMYTSYNPDFVVSNFIRDAIYTMATVWLKESPEYAARFNKNKTTTCTPINMGRLILKYSAGTLDMNNEVEKAFYDFVMNGGETGYAKLASIEQLKTDIGHMIEPTMFDNVKALGKKLAFINRSAESSARFAAFLTSRQMGRSVARSVADAKEISVNFNKKGAGELFMGAKDQTWVGKRVAGSMGWTIPMYAFFNAGMQGLNNFLRIYKHAPLKTTALTTGLFLLGALIASMLEGDDEEEYYALPESVRRQNIVFRAGDNAWVKIPLPIEMRAIYGLGEMFTSIAKGKEDLSDHGIAYKMAEQLSQVLPINILEGKGGLGTLVPTFAAPIAETMSNEDWAGLPIYRDDIYKGDSDIPEYLRVYQRTGEGYVAASEFLNDITGGDNRERGALGFVNPAVIEHLVDGYLGGPAQFMNKVISAAEMAVGDKEFDLRAIPFVNRVLMSNNTTMSKKTINNYYYRHKEEAERIDRLVKNYQKDMNDPKKTDEERAYAAEKAQEKRDSDEWLKAQEFLRRTSAVEDIEEQFKDAPEGTSDEIIYEVKDFANEVYKKAEK